MFSEHLTHKPEGDTIIQKSVEPECILLTLKRIDEILMKEMQTTERKSNKCKYQNIKRFKRIKVS